MMVEQNKNEIFQPITKAGCHKLESLADFLQAYTRTGKKGGYYLELYAGCGRCTCPGTDCYVDGSALRALKAGGFEGYILVVPDPEKAESLKRLTVSMASTIQIVAGNSNQDGVRRRILDLIPRSASSLALLDPGGYRRMRWTTLEQLAEHGKDWRGKKMELLVLFPLEMALLRNLARPECQSSITRLYGNQGCQRLREQWRDDRIGLDEVRGKLVEFFVRGLKRLGYRYVAEYEPPLPHPPLYHPILASDYPGREVILKETWSKPRYLPCELLYGVKEPAREM